MKSNQVHITDFVPAPDREMAACILCGYPSTVPTYYLGERSHVRFTPPVCDCTGGGQSSMAVCMTNAQTLGSYGVLRALNDSSLACHLDPATQ
jgi:hypothetical protein